MLTARIGLLDLTGAIDPRLMAAAASALNVQVTRDLPQFWPVKASVTYLADPSLIAPGMWPVRIVHSLAPGEGGCCVGAHNQPFARVVNTPGGDEWTLDASHEICEMLVDPYGNALQASPPVGLEDGVLRDQQGAVEYLVEPCEPCASAAAAYEIDGVMVSDFISARYFDRVATAGVRYSFAGSICAPRQVLPGGRLSWIDLRTDEVRQVLRPEASNAPTLRNLGLPTGCSLRAFVDGRTSITMRPQRLPPNLRARAARRTHREQLHQAAGFRSRWFV
ncbi:MAG TPA: hypothetical protein VGH03_15535 [Caulobacteraceae bacterium]|jgi:hypothetical protein